MPPRPARNSSARWPRNQDRAIVAPFVERPEAHFSPACWQGWLMTVATAHQPCRIPWGTPVGSHLSKSVPSEPAGLRRAVSFARGHLSAHPRLRSRQLARLNGLSHFGSTQHRLANFRSILEPRSQPFGGSPPGGGPPPGPPGGPPPIGGPLFGRPKPPRPPIPGPPIIPGPPRCSR